MANVSAAEEAYDALAHSLAGAGGGCIALALTYPLLTATTRLQVQHNQPDQRRYTNLWDVIVRTTTEEGWAKLYAGLKPALAGNIVSMGVYYYWYALLMSLAQGRDERGKPLRLLSTPMTLLIATAAGAINASITQPLWTVTTRMQTDKKRSGVIASTFELVKEQGVLGLWTGLVPALILVANPAVQFVVYEQLKIACLKATKQKNLSAFQIFMLGAVGKTAATVVTYPWIVLKSRMQAAHGADAVVPEESYHGTLDAIVRTYRNDGIAGFYNGLRSKIAQSVLTAAILFVMKEKLLYYTRKLLLALAARRPNAAK